MADFSDRKTKQLNIRLTEDEYFLLELLSKRWYGKPNVSKVVRYIIKFYARSVLKEVFDNDHK